MTSILIVDREPGVGASLRELLQDAGYEVHVVNATRPALDLLPQHDIDVVLAGIIPPLASGVQLLEAIKEAAPRIQVVLMTDQPTVETAAAAVRQGAFDYLVKPVTEAMLLETVASAARLKALEEEKAHLAEENRARGQGLELLVAERTKALRESEERMRAALHGADLGTWDWRIATSEVCVNERWALIQGFQPAEIEPHVGAWGEGVHPDDASFVQHAMNAHLEGTTQHYEAEYRLRSKSGDWTWVLDKARVFERDSDGAPTRVTGTLLDITAQKRAQARSRLLTRVVEDSLHETYLVDEKTLRFIEANRGARRNLGYSMDELRGMGPSDVVANMSKSELRALIAPLRIGGGESVRLTTEQRRKDGSTYPAEVFVERLGEGPGRFVAWVTDITDRKRIEDERSAALTAAREAYAEVQALTERLAAENVLLRHEVRLGQPHGAIVGASPALAASLRLMEEVSGTDASVLLLGETGTGKELFAREIHARSLRSEGPLIAVNCAALPEALMERELFGAEKGAYTGADRRSVGRFEAADGGTLFLDEVCELAPGLQAKLLRVLEDGCFERLGGSKTIHADVRVITATNADLNQRVEEGRFRADLLYRLDVFPILLPPLRERAGDVPLLVDTFVAALAEKMGKRIEGVSIVSMRLLEAHDWPGNVRELRNVVERALILCHGTTLDIALPPGRAQGSAPALSDVKLMAVVERRHLLSVLEGADWRVRGDEGAAEILGLKPSTLESRMRKHGIKRP